MEEQNIDNNQNQEFDYVHIDFLLKKTLMIFFSWKKEELYSPEVNKIFLNFQHKADCLLKDLLQLASALKEQDVPYEDFYKIGGGKSFFFGENRFKDSDLSTPYNRPGTMAYKFEGGIVELRETLSQIEFLFSLVEEIKKDRLIEKVNKVVSFFEDFLKINERRKNE